MGRVRAHRFIVAAAISLIFASTHPTPAAEPLVALEGNHPDQASELVTTAPAPASRVLSMTFTMAIRNQADLDKLLAAQQDPASPEYHRWLTAAEFANRFGPSATDLAHVTRWLAGKGFTVASTDASTREVVFSGTVSQAQKAFGVKIAASDDGALFANTADPKLPAALVLMVESIRGLDNLLHSTALAHRIAPKAPAAGAPLTDVGDLGPNFGPTDLYTFYDETPLLTASTPIDGDVAGCIAVVEDSDLDQPAMAAFDTQFGLPALSEGSNFDINLVDNGDPGKNADQDETMIDVNYSHAIAPAASIRVYLGDQAKSHSLAVLDAIKAAVTEKQSPCTAIGISFGFCGGSKSFYKSESNLFAQAAAQGVSIFVASGDAGAAGLKLDKKNGTCVTGTSPNINELAASPYVTAVGGTSFDAVYDDNGNDVGFVAESVWNDSDGVAGGGESKVFKKPAFQSGVSPKDKKRDIPDISFAASPNSPGFYFGGRENNIPTVVCCIGGTSIGAPSWAGISQLIAQANGAPVGNLNARLYQMGGANTPSTTGIRDVTTGNNTYNHVKGFAAGPGYDKASGWGTVDLGIFVPAFASP